MAFDKKLNIEVIKTPKDSLTILTDSVLPGETNALNNLFGGELLARMDRASDMLKMLIVAIVMIYMNWELSLIVFISLPFILLATKIFQKYMKLAFDEVRNEVANLNSFVQILSSFPGNQGLNSIDS